MISYILEELKEGNHDVVATFVELESLWTEFFDTYRDESVNEMAEALSSLQYRIEKIAGDRDRGKAFMTWSAFAHLYDVTAGFEDNEELAAKLAKAFQMSSCSLEVKGSAEKAAKLYSVDIT